MSFGFGVGDFLAVGNLCWTVYKNCKESSGNYKELANEVGALHNVIKETEELLSQQQLSHEQKIKLDLSRSGCEGVLQDLDKLLAKYAGLGTKSQRTFDRMGFGMEDMNSIRTRLISNVTLLDAFNNVHSHASLEKKLNLLITEIRAGKREGSVVSTRTIDSLARRDQETWDELRRELEDVGISPFVITEKRQFIITWFQEAVAAGKLEEDPVEENVFSDQDSLMSDYESKQSDTTSSRPSTNLESISGPPGRNQNENETPRLRLSYLLDRLRSKDRQLLKAADLGDAKAIEDLLRKGANLEVRSAGPTESTALDGAVDGQHQAVVQVLLKAGANANSTSGFARYTALHCAAVRGYEAIARLLLHYGADVNWKYRDDFTPLHNAAIGGHEAMIRLLLDNGASINATNAKRETALHCASKLSNEPVVRVLLSQGADYRPRTEEGLAALHYAAEAGNAAIVGLLLSGGANVESRSTLLQETALHLAIRNRRGNSWNDQKGVIRLLIQYGAEVSAKDESGDTPFSLAQAPGREQLLHLLVDEEAFYCNAI